MNNNEVLVEVQNVSKRFCKDFKRSIRYGFIDSLRALAGKDMDADSLRKDEFWAVRDISFQLKRGECLGLIGHNGAGKSTLLKMLNGLIQPDHGKITMRGRLGALIELGAGFNSILTGRENIYNNAAVLGFSKKEIDKKLNDIVAFSEIGQFLDTPVQNYSSGMKVRLGFAIAAQMEPDVLIIDEVLAVGDIGFRVKCLNRISELLNNCAVIFVSHSMPQVGRICTHISHMSMGKMNYYGADVGQGIRIYQEGFKKENLSIIGDGFEIYNFRINQDSKDESEVQFGALIRIDFDYLNKSHYRNWFINIIFMDANLNGVAVLSSKRVKKRIFSKDQNHVTIFFKSNLTQGRYPLNIAVMEDNEISHYKYGANIITYRSIASILVRESELVNTVPVQLDSQWEN